MVFVYILKSEVSEKMYVGMTQDLSRRLAEHNSGKSKFTKGYKPWKLLYSEKLDDYKEARKREKYLKSGQGRDWIKENMR